MTRQSPTTVLVVEDNPVTRKMLRVCLETAGYTVEEAADARAALSLAATRMPDLVLQDMILPDLYGFELAEALRALPGGDELPIIVLSGFAGQVDSVRAEKVGFAALLMKPVEPSDLLRAVTAVCPPHGTAASKVGGTRIVAVDHSAKRLKLLREFLSRAGYDVTMAKSAFEAVRLMRSESARALVCAAELSDVSGFELCCELRCDPELTDTRVVLLADAPQPPDLERAQRVGASALVERTVELTGLEAALAQALAMPPPEYQPPGDRARLARAHALLRQADRHAEAQSGLAQRCALQAAQLSLLGGIASALAARSSVASVLRDVLAATLDAAAISRGALLIMDLSGRLTLREVIGFSAPEAERLVTAVNDPRVAGEISRRRRALARSKYELPRTAKALLETVGLGDVDLVPLVSDQGGIGGLVLGARASDHKSEDATTFARAIAGHLAAVLQLERAFEQLSIAEQRYRALMEYAHDAISVLTPEGVVREVNRRTEELLGRPREQILGRHISEFAAPGQVADNNHAYMDSVSRGVARTPPVALARPDGVIVLVEFSSATVDVGAERLVFTLGRDVTEQVKSQAQLMVSDRMASIGMLAAGVAHEINNPLAAVTANLELAATEVEQLAARGAAPRDLRDEISDAREAAERVRTIVRDLKIFSRAEEDIKSAVDVHRVLDSSLRMAFNEIRHRAQLVKDYAAVPPLLANESRLGQVFLNLVVNAAQAIPEGCADANEVRVRTRHDEQCRRIIVEIIDTGSGIPADVLPKLFTPFFTTKPRGVGTGLGLAICHRFVTDLSGDIGVESTPGKGTTIRLSLPTAETEQLPKKSRKAPEPNANRGRILVVDDDRLVGVALRRLLERSHEVRILTCARAALDLLAEDADFDIIFCDLMMPVVTGVQFYEELAKLAPQLVSRVVFLTGGAFTPAARAFLDETPNVHLEKPFSPADIRAVVAEQLKR